MSSPLLQPLGRSSSHKLSLRNRIAMASMTRNRCIDDHAPGPATVRYYAERAQDGPAIIITEGILVDWAGVDYPHPPFLVTESQAEAWKKVVDAVHAKSGSKIYWQAWHAGRAQNDEMPIMKATGTPVLAPSAIPGSGWKYHHIAGNPGHTKNVRAIENPNNVIETYRRSAILAQKAGFDGVELLCQGGFLPHQFLSSRSNERTDAYGGSVANRCRFAFELVKMFGDVFGSVENIIAKIAPCDVLNDSVVAFEEMVETYTQLIDGLVHLGIGIICISRRGGNHATRDGVFERPKEFPLPEGYDPVLEFGPLVQKSGGRTLIMAGQDYSVDEAEQVVKEGKADLVQLGRPFIWNPDLVSRIRQGLPLAENHRGGRVLYGPYEDPNEGYNDWPVATRKAAGGMQDAKVDDHATEIAVQA